MLQGVVEGVTFRAPETGYTVVRLRPERGFGPIVETGGLWPSESRVTAVGTAEALDEGLRVRLHGRWSEHRKHGRRFEFAWYQPLPPLDQDGLVRYLASSTFRGIGPKLAARIVERLGTNALVRIRTEPECLTGIRGLSGKARERLVATLRTELGGQELFAFLLGVGLGPHQAALVAKKLGPDAEPRLRADPYLLARGIPGIGFHTADRVARELGLPEDAPERRQAAALHVLRTAANEGHTLLPERALVEGIVTLIGLSNAAGAADPESTAAADLAALAERGDVVIERGEQADAGGSDGAERSVYLAMLHTCETQLATNLRTLLESGPVRPLAGEAELVAAEGRAGLELHAAQRLAVLGLLREPLALLTGGPGVGKTTIVRLVVELAERADRRVVLASPTGRAAKRLAEATGREASTVHRLLGFEPGTGRFAHDARRPLGADLVVVDEISMLDVVLAHHLAKALQPPTRLVLVGDPDQLPSVSAGNVLADLLACERIPVFRLTEVFRQERESLIVRNAHHVLAGEPPELPARGAAPADFYFFEADGDEEAAALLSDVVTRRIPQRFGLAWVDDVQVLSPMYRGPCGVDALNARLREALGLGGRELRWGERLWRIGDRVIQTRNDYEKHVFNGDMGRISGIAADGQTLTVRFPDRELVYERGEFSDLQPAFAITVHRSQGAEYPAVVMPLVPAHRLMLQRNLLYTAITRARRLVVLVGSRRALEMALANAEQAERRSGLAGRLRP